MKKLLLSAIILLFCAITVNAQNYEQKLTNLFNKLNIIKTEEEIKELAKQMELIEQENKLQDDLESSYSSYSRYSTLINLANRQIKNSQNLIDQSIINRNNNNTYQNINVIYSTPYWYYPQRVSQGIQYRNRINSIRSSYRIR